MSFSDADKKRLKEDSEKMGFISRNQFAIQDLLARLDAAEKALVLAYNSLDSGAQFNHVDIAYKAWLKSKGL